jgi:hypothetical protein
MDSAIAWYLHGVKTNANEAKVRARRAFDEAWNNAPWKRGQDVDNWARGAVMFRVVFAAYLLRNEPEVTSRIAEIKTVIKNQAVTYLNRWPESGYSGDTKAEENAWHASFLAAAVNLFPDATGSDRQWIEERARCFAYHSLTLNESYCGRTTQTVHSDWTLENHGMKNPIYMAGTIQLLAEGALTYQLSGQSIPWEFTHNVQPLYNKYIEFVDTNTYHYKNFLVIGMVLTVRPLFPQRCFGIWRY